MVFYKNRQKIIHSSEKAFVFCRYLTQAYLPQPIPKSASKVSQKAIQEKNLSKYFYYFNKFEEN